MLLKIYHGGQLPSVKYKNMISQKSLAPISAEF